MSASKLHTPPNSVCHTLDIGQKCNANHLSLVRRFCTAKPTWLQRSIHLHSRVYVEGLISWTSFLIVTIILITLYHSLTVQRLFSRLLPYLALDLLPPCCTCKIPIFLPVLKFMLLSISTTHPPNFSLNNRIYSETDGSSCHTLFLIVLYYSLFHWSQCFKIFFRSVDCICHCLGKNSGFTPIDKTGLFMLL